MKNLYGTQFNISHIEPATHIYGPGRRFAVWLQGCSLACKGCWNEQMWSFKTNELLDRKTLLAKILAEQDIEGITLLGGEPLDQAENTVWLIQETKRLSSLTVMLYTGYTKPEIEQKKLWSTIEDSVDLLVSGRYQEQHRNTNNQWYGSENQKLIYPKKSSIEQRSKLLNEVEIIIEETGEVRVLGYPA
ncbi:4Fe-4S single cluster domain-containing protein [Photobacterium sanguinicancri]|uniref:4Fe-4S single cluster domain-containing protein n=1 Tax=Photobacterium sanguinicancri TaxID=875932 RepID=UPI002480FA78|nr:4Fe-4S single cluster domain-containing protein [Photobacterium sanguinicancri]